jgi:hypothetical protein
MPSELDKLAKELKEQFGLDLADVLRGTHAETATVVASLVGDMLELALRSKLLVEKKPANDAMFEGNGTLGTLHKRINKAHELNLIDDVTRDDAHLVRRIRNDFGHTSQPEVPWTCSCIRCAATIRQQSKENPTRH